MEGRGHVLQTMLILLFLSTAFTGAYPTSLACLAGTVAASGRCDTGHVCVRASVLFVFSGESAAERKLHPPSERGKCLSGEVSISATVCVCVCAGKEGVAFPHRRLSLGIASTKILSFLLSIRGELRLYFGPNHLQSKPQENAALQSLNTVSDPFLFTQTY